MSVIRLTTKLGTDDGSYGEAVPFPVRVVDKEGTVIAETAASPTPQDIDVPDSIKEVFVRAYLPSGEKQTKRLELQPGTTVNVSFFLERVSPHEWLAWSRPHITLQGLPELGRSLADLDEVWLRTWVWDKDRWKDGPRNFQYLAKDRYAASFALQVPQTSMLIQVGGNKVPWRLVALPPGNVRVALSINRSTDRRHHPVRVVISRQKPAEEVLLAFLGRNDLAAANDLANAPRVAERLLWGKYDDPMSACVGAYFLLRTNDVQRMHTWPLNLYRDFQWLPDAAIIYATTLIRRGRPNFVEIVDALELVMQRGLPIYREGLSLYSECLHLINGSRYKTPKSQRLLEQASGYVLAQIGETTTLSFLGVTPSSPSPIPRMGPPESPKRIDPYRALKIARVREPPSLANAVNVNRLRKPTTPSATSAAKRVLKAERKSKKADSVWYLYGPKAKP